MSTKRKPKLTPLERCIAASLKVKPFHGWKRTFMSCKECKKVAWYDYQPYSLANPILTSPCEHFFRENYREIKRCVIEKAKETALKKLAEAAGI